MNYSFSQLLRTAFRNRGLTLINIAGLSVGLAISLFLLVYLNFEFSYDEHFPDADRIYRVLARGENQQEVMTVPLTLYEVGDRLSKEIPEIEYAARLFRKGGGIFETEKETKLSLKGYMVDSSFLDIFRFPVLYGQLEGALNSSDRCVITRKYAEAFFGEGVNPVGKSLIDSQDKKIYQVSAVIGNIPENTHFSFDILTKLSDLGYGSMEYLTYLKFKPGVDIPAAVAKSEEVAKKIFEAKFAGMGYTFSSIVEPVVSIHLSSLSNFDLKEKANKSNLVFIVLVVIFILGIAICNFVSLYIIQGEKRANEISVRKTNGAMRRSIVGMLFSETFLVTFIAFLLALGLYFTGAEWFARLINFHIPQEAGLSWGMWGSFVGVFLGVALLAGGYPAYYLSRFSPLNLIRKTAVRKYKLTAASVVVQFSVVIFCVSALGVVMRQLHYVKEMPLGFKSENILTTYVNSDIKSYETLRAELLQYPEIKRVAVAQGSIVSGWSGGGLRLPSQSQEDGQNNLDQRRVGPGFMELYQIPILQGRSFSDNQEAEKSNIILSESIVSALGLEDPVGQKVIAGNETYTIIGVAKDIHYTSAHEKGEKMYYTFYATDYWNLSISYEAGKYEEAREHFLSVLKARYPGDPLFISTIRSEIDDMYVQDEVTGRILTSGTLVAIVLALLGLLALSGFVAQQKRKEIGVRRVLGAQVGEIVFDMNRYIVLRILPAIPLGLVSSYYLMNRWLDSFEYSIPLSWWIFGASLLVTLLIAVLTILYQSIRSATANPVNALKSE